MDGAANIPTRTINDLIVAEPYAALLRQHGLDSLAALLAYRSDESLDKPGLPPWRQRLRVELTNGDGAAHTFYLKRYLDPPASEQRPRILSSDARHGSAWREWRWMRTLSAAGIACPIPVAYGESMQGRRERASVVVAAKVPGRSLEAWAANREEPAPRELVVSLADFIGAFHALGCIHRDLYLCHIFYDAASRAKPFHLIDLHRVMRPRFRHDRWRVKDLAALNYSSPGHVVSNTDRLRFFRRYLQSSKLRPADKRFARRILAKTRSIAAHDARRTARLANASEVRR